MDPEHPRRTRLHSSAISSQLEGPRNLMWPTAIDPAVAGRAREPQHPLMFNIGDRAVERSWRMEGECLKAFERTEPLSSRKRIQH